MRMSLEEYYIVIHCIKYQFQKMKYKKFLYFKNMYNHLFCVMKLLVIEYTVYKVDNTHHTYIMKNIDKNTFVSSIENIMRLSINWHEDIYGSVRYEFRDIKDFENFVDNNNVGINYDYYNDEMVSTTNMGLMYFDKNNKLRIAIKKTTEIDFYTMDFIKTIIDTFYKNGRLLNKTYRTIIV